MTDTLCCWHDNYLISWVNTWVNVCFFKVVRMRKRVQWGFMRCVARLTFICPISSFANRCSFLRTFLLLNPKVPMHIPWEINSKNSAEILQSIIIFQSEIVSWEREITSRTYSKISPSETNFFHIVCAYRSFSTNKLFIFESIKLEKLPKWQYPSSKNPGSEKWIHFRVIIIMNNIW